MGTNKYIFLSHVLDKNTPSYGNRDRLEVEKVSLIGEVGTVNASRWTLTSNHLGSHLDLPRHFFNDGAAVTDYAAGEFIFRQVQLVDYPMDNARLIDDVHIGRKLSRKTDLLLLRTGYESCRNTDKYWKDNPGLAPSLGRYLRKNFPCLRAVGFDFISLSSWKFKQEGKEAHRIFLNPGGPGNPLLVLEDLSLRDITGSVKEVIVAPFRVRETDGTPVTVFASLHDSGPAGGPETG